MNNLDMNKDAAASQLLVCNFISKFSALLFILPILHYFRAPIFSISMENAGVTPISVLTAHCG
jgi:hypothetical protein